MIISRRTTLFRKKKQKFFNFEESKSPKGKIQDEPVLLFFQHCSSSSVVAYLVSLIQFYLRETLILFVFYLRQSTFIIDSFIQRIMTFPILIMFKFSHDLRLEIPFKNNYRSIIQYLPLLVWNLNFPKSMNP